MTNQQTGALRVAAEGEREVVTERVFDAPRELVFRAFVDPELVPRWWGRRDDVTTVDKMDVREGGDWRFLTDGPDGAHAFRGTYRSIQPPELLEQTFEWEGLPGHVVVETATFEDLGDGRTKVSTRSRFDTTEDRDGMLASGMEIGLGESYERLDELLAGAGAEE
jgi:uncharacterized protein YndB with AHSA1/START domain